MTKKIVNIIVIILLAISAVSIICLVGGSLKTTTVVNTKSSREEGKGYYISHKSSVSDSYDEWVSPDGVHYWWRSNGYLAPRYDNEGNLVIDKE